MTGAPTDSIPPGDGDPSGAAAVRTATVWWPAWPVTVACRADPGLVGRPVAVLERVGPRVVVRAASGTARAVGVRVGLGRREAEARCPDLVTLDADPAAEVAGFEDVARAVEAFTPRVEVERPGRLAFPTRGPARYFGGDETLADRVLGAVAESLGPVGPAPRVGIADGRFASRLAARGGRAVVPPGGSAAFLAPLPVAALGDDELAGLLVRLGLPTLGAFAALDPAAVLARFGAPGRRYHRLARGIDPEPASLAPPPPDLVEVVELDPPAERVDAAAFAARGLATRLVERLAEQGLGLTRVVVEAETEHGETLTRCWRHDGAFSSAALVDRVRWQLEGWLTGSVAPGALLVLRLLPDEVVALGGSQLGFWGGDRAAADRAGRALARVQGILGPGAVVTAVPQGGRMPAERCRWVPWGEPRDPEPGSGPAPAWPGAVPGPAPAWVPEPPWPAELRAADGEPVRVSGRGEPSADPAALHCAGLAGGGGPVVGWAGPWLQDERWWDRRTRRRRALWQLTVALGPRRGDGAATTRGRCGSDGDAPLVVACLVAVERGRATVRALYD